MRLLFVFILIYYGHALQVNQININTVNDHIHSDSLFEIIINVSEPLKKDKSIVMLHWKDQDHNMEFQYTYQHNHIYTWSLYTNQLINRPTKRSKRLQISPETTLVSLTGESININTDLSFLYENSCVLPPNLIGYNTTKCSPGLVTLSDCHVSCLPGATSGNVSIECSSNDGFFNIDGCSKRCKNEGKEGYIGCDTTKHPLSEDACIVTCQQGFVNVNTIKKTCEKDGNAFEFNGCERICELTQPIDSGYIVSGTCESESSCKVTCESGYVDTGARATCLQDGTFRLHGCEVETCLNSDISCDDNVHCTEDICEHGICINRPNNNKCNDNIECTENVCTEKGCHTTFNHFLCDDKVSCTEDLCTDTGCIHNKKKELCDDNDVCTIDSCTDKGCSHVPIECNDNIECTMDSCDPKHGCMFMPDHSVCKDNIDCTVDTCTSAGCEHRKDELSCDDGFECTKDTCTATGCTHVKNHSVCFEKSKCSTNTCEPEISNDSKGCLNRYDHKQCYDGIGCTKDMCTSSGCEHKNVCLGNHLTQEDCVLNLEMFENGKLARPYLPCLEGKTFDNCTMVQVTLSIRYDEIKLTEQMTKGANKSFCDPNPCINSPCLNTTGTYECICPEGQQGRHCEMVKVKEVPARDLSFLLSLVIGISLLGIICLSRKKKTKAIKKTSIQRKTLMFVIIA